MNTLRYYMPGIILILIAIMVVAVPEILVAFMASILVIAGIGALFIGHKIRKSQIGFRQAEEWSSDEDFFGRRFLRRPLFRDWNRWYWQSLPIRRESLYRWKGASMQGSLIWFNHITGPEARCPSRLYLAVSKDQPPKSYSLTDVIFIDT